MPDMKRKHAAGAGGRIRGRPSAAVAKKARSGSQAAEKPRKTASGARQRALNAYDDAAHRSDSMKGHSDSDAADRERGFRTGVMGVDGRDKDGLDEDEEIDSDEAFESGDDERYSSFRFRGSSSKRKQARTCPDDASLTTNAKERLMRRTKASRNDVATSISLAEESSGDENTQSMRVRQLESSSAMTARQSSGRPMDKQSDSDASDDSSLEHGSQTTASDFEDDDADDLMDLSEMLGSTNSSGSNVRSIETGQRRLSRSHLDTLDEIPYERASMSGSEAAGSELLSESPDMHTDDSNNSDSVHEDSSDQESVDLQAEDNLSRLSSTDALSDDGQVALRRFVDSLDSKDVKHDSMLVPARRTEVDINEGKRESEHNVTVLLEDGKLRLEDLMRGISSEDVPELEQRGKRKFPLPAPLARPIQERVDRAAAYEAVKKHISKWQPAVKQMREADHIHFKALEKGLTTSNSLAADTVPSNTFEEQLFELLEHSGLKSERDVTSLEDFELAKLSQEEVASRRAELAKLRDLLFRQERKAKREAKIKSKSYRRIHRKEKERLRAELQAADGEQDDAEELARKREEARARERVELRHKNTGKWAQRMIARSQPGDGSRQAISDQLRKGEELTRKIREGPDMADSEDDDTCLAYPGDRDTDLPHEGVFAMKFMRDADEKTRQDRMTGWSNGDDNDDTYDDLDPAKDTTFIGNNVGHRMFTGGTLKTALNASKNPFQLRSTAVKDGLISNADTDSAAPIDRQRNGVVKEDFPEVNPWLAADPVRSTAPDRFRTTRVYRKDDDANVKFAAKLAKRGASSKDPRLQLGNIKLRTTSTMTAVGNAVADDSENDDKDDENHLNSEMLPNARKGPIALKQADLVAQAFAGDDVIAEFADIKEAVTLEDAPIEVNTRLPGWGSWGGAGVGEKQRKRQLVKDKARFIKTMPSGIAKEARRDAKLGHVVLNEKRLKQAQPLMAQKVPFPFETREQYERSLRMPLGPEWATRSTFQRQTKPRVMVDHGTIVHPMAKPFEED